MTKKNNTTQNNYTNRCIDTPLGPYKEVFRNTKSLLPLPESDGTYYYTDRLCYLLRVMPQNTDFYKVLGLANYSLIHNGLTEKQRAYAEDLITKYTLYGYFEDQLDSDIESFSNKEQIDYVTNKH